MSQSTAASSKEKDTVRGITGISVRGYKSLYTAAFEKSIRQVIHVPGLRGNPERTYKITAIGSAFTGTFENYVASINPESDRYPWELWAIANPNNQ